MHHLMIMVSSAGSAVAGGCRLVAVVVTLSKGYDLEYMWRQTSPGAQMSAAGY